MIEAQLQATATLIDAEGQMVSIVRPTLAVDDGEGGYTRVDNYDPPVLAAVKRFFGSTLRQGELIRTPEGEIFKTEHVLIGPPEDDIQKLDTFELFGREFVVRYVQPDRRYQTKGYVTSHVKP